LNTLILKAEAS